MAFVIDFLFKKMVDRVISLIEYEVQKIVHGIYRAEMPFHFLKGENTVSGHYVPVFLSTIRVSASVFLNLHSILLI